MAYGLGTTKQPVGAPKLAFGAPIFSELWNLYGGLRSEQQWQDFQRDQVDPANRAGAAAVSSLGRIPDVVSGSQRLADQAGDFAGRYFDPSQQRSQYDSRMAPISGALSDLPGQIGRQTSGALGQYGDAALGIQYGLGSAMSGFQNEAAGINQGYAEQLTRARGLVEGISDQDRRDANRRFDQEGAGAAAGLRARGLGGSTIAPSVQGAVEGRRGDELRRISDQRLQQQLGVESTFGGAGLAARAGLAGTGLSGALQAGGVQSNLASNALSGGINAANLASQTGLSAAQQRSGIVSGRFDTVNNAALNRLGVMNDFGKYPYDVGLDVGREATNYWGPRILTPPQGFNPIQAAPRGGR